MNHNIYFHSFTVLYLTLVFCIPDLCHTAHSSRIVTKTVESSQVMETSNESTVIPSDLPDSTLGSIKLSLAAAFFFGVFLACGIPILLIDWLQKKDTQIGYGPSGHDGVANCGDPCVTGRTSMTAMPTGHTHDMISADSDTDSPSGLTPNRQPTDMWANGLSRGHQNLRQQQQQQQQPRQPSCHQEQERQNKISTASEPLSTPNRSPILGDAEHTDLLTGQLVSTAGDWPHSRRHHNLTANETRRTGKLAARFRRSTIHTFRSSATRKILLRLWFSRLNCFAAGIFLSSGFMELYVDVEESIEEAKTQLNVKSEFPFAPFLTLVGFFLVLSLEQIIWTMRLSRQQPKTITTRSPRSTRPSITSAREADLPSPCGNGCLFRSHKFDESVESPQTAMSPLNSSTHFTFTDEALMPVPQTPTGPTPFDCESSDLFTPAESQPIPKSELLLDDNHSYSHHTPNSPNHSCQIHNRRLPPTLYQNMHNHHQCNHSPRTSPPAAPHPLHRQHSHLPSAEGLTSFGALLQVVVLLCAMSVHSLFEGLAVGLQSTVHHTLSLFSAILLHKLIIAAGIGVNLATATTTSSNDDESTTTRTPVSSPGANRSVVNRRIVAYQSLATLIFAGSSPLGVLIGWGLLRDAPQSGTLLMSTAILQGLACGTFFFVVFCELLPTEFREGVGDRLGKLLFLILGFLMVALYSFFMPH
ncbi:Zinc transporter zip1 [Fasciola hepatica]|uniref:Zinc transporter zip1 n=1 Tax=Fasciola hepatica TaxID=6192 RepID=A0A4E0S3H3_FASHE|nr:Zinc transporter zip1 [Fasciola hepatica]